MTKVSPAGAEEASTGDGGSHDDQHRGLTRRKGRYVLWLVLAAVCAIPVFWVAAWWATVPLISLLGFTAWKRYYWLAGILGGGVGMGFWIIELELYPSAAVAKLTAALAGAEGFPPSLLFLLGPILFGLVTAFAALTVAGALRLFAPIPDVSPKSIPSP